MDNTNSGYFLVHRSAYEHPVLEDTRPETRRGAWLDLIRHAQWEERSVVRLKGRDYELRRGQQARSKETLRQLWKWSKATVDRFLKQLEAEGMITISSDAITTIITICNYEKHQRPRSSASQLSSQLSSQAYSQLSSQAHSQLSSQAHSQPASQVSSAETPLNQRGLGAQDMDSEPTSEPAIEPASKPTTEPASKPTSEPTSEGADEVQINNLINLTTTNSAHERPDEIRVSEWHLNQITLDLIKKTGAVPDDFIEHEKAEFLIFYDSENYAFSFNKWSSRFFKQCVENWRKHGYKWRKSSEADQCKSGPNSEGQHTGNWYNEEFESELAELARQSSGVNGG